MAARFPSFDAPFACGTIEGFARAATSGATGTWSPGYARCESDTRNLRSTSNIVIDATVTGANGRSSAATAPASGVAYYVYAIVDASGTVAGLLDNNAVPTLPSGYVDYVRIGVCCMSGASTMREQRGYANGRFATDHYVLGDFTASATDAQVALSLSTAIPAGAGGTVAVRAEVGLSSPVAVSGQAPYVRSTAAGSYWYRSWANLVSRQQVSMPVTEDNLYVDATEPGTTLQGQLILLSLTFERGGSLA